MGEQWNFSCWCGGRWYLWIKRKWTFFYRQTNASVSQPQQEVRESSTALPCLLSFSRLSSLEHLNAQNTLAHCVSVLQIIQSDIQKNECASVCALVKTLIRPRLLFCTGLYILIYIDTSELLLYSLRRLHYLIHLNVKAIMPLNKSIASLRHNKWGINLNIKVFLNHLWKVSGLVGSCQCH